MEFIALSLRRIIGASLLLVTAGVLTGTRAADEPAPGGSRLSPGPDTGTAAPTATESVVPATPTATPEPAAPPPATAATATPSAPAAIPVPAGAEAPAAAAPPTTTETATVLPAAMPAAGINNTSLDEGILNAGDLIRVRMAEDPSISFEGLISVSGTIPVPYLGEFFIARMTPSEASKALSSALCQGMYQKATISITLVTKGPGKIYVYGAVRRPGVVGMPPVGGLTMIQIMSFVEGLTSWASPEETFILRRGKPGQPPTKIPVNLSQLLSSSQSLIEADIPLQADDIVCIPGVNGTLFLSSDTCEVVVVGEVNIPGMIQFAPGEQRTLMRAILKAGGFSKFAKKEQIRLIRYEKDKQRTEKNIDGARIIDKGFLNEDVELKPGDMLIVPQRVFTI